MYCLTIFQAQRYIFYLIRTPHKHYLFIKESKNQGIAEAILGKVRRGLPCNNAAK